MSVQKFSVYIFLYVYTIIKAIIHTLTVNTCMCVWRILINSQWVKSWKKVVVKDSCWKFIFIYLLKPIQNIFVMCRKKFWKPSLQYCAFSKTHYATKYYVETLQFYLSLPKETKFIWESQSLCVKAFLNWNNPKIRAKK